MIDSEFFSEICEKNHHRFVHEAATSVGADAAEDVVQQAYACVWAMRDRLEADKDRVTGYIAQAVSNACHLHRRKSARQKDVYAEMAGAHVFRADAVEDHEPLDRIGADEVEQVLQAKASERFTWLVNVITEVGEFNSAEIERKTGRPRTSILRMKAELVSYLAEKKVDPRDFTRYMDGRIAHRSWKVRRERVVELSRAAITYMWLAKACILKGDPANASILSNNEWFIELKATRPYYAALALGKMYELSGRYVTFDEMEGRRHLEVQWVFGTQLMRFLGQEKHHGYIDNPAIFPLGKSDSMTPVHELLAFFEMSRCASSCLSFLTFSARHEEEELPAILRDPTDKVALGLKS